MGIIITAILAATVAFLGATLYSSVDAHQGRNAVKIESVDSTVDYRDFYSELAHFARENDVGVAISYSSIAISNGEYRVYSSSVSPDAGRTEKPRFEHGEIDVVYPLEDFPHPDPRQIVFAQGSGANVQKLLQWLGEQGIDAVVWPSILIQIFATSTIPILFVLSVLLCLILGAGHSLIRSREIGVHRLLGLSVSETMINEARRQRRVLLTAYVGGPLIVSVLLYMYNGWALARVFWAFFFLASAVLSVCLFTGYLGGQGVVRMTSIPQSIKGRVNARPVFYSLAVVRCVTLVAALSAVAALVGVVAELGERQRLQAAWDAHQGPQEFALNTNTSIEDWTDAATVEPFRTADEAGEVFLVDPYWMTWPVELEAPVLLVNQEFTQQAGATQLDNRGIVVCSPVELSRDSMQTIQDALDFEAELSHEPVPAVEWRSHCSLGTVFTYDVDFHPQVENPILVILPRGLAPFGNDNLISEVSQQTLISVSPSVPSYLLKGATGATLSFSRPREDSWQESKRTAENYVVLWGLNTVAALLLVTVLVGAAIITFRVAYRRKIHIAYIFGRSPWWVSKELIVIEVAFFLAVIGWLFYKLREHQIQSDLQAPSTWNIGFESQWSPSTIVAVVGFSLAWLMASVLLTLKAASQWDARESTEPQ